MSEYRQLADAYDSDDRCAPPPDDECTQVVESIEVGFHIPVYVTSDQIQRLHELIDEIASAPCNQPKGGVHWLSEYGSKPRWSQADQRVLGLPNDPDAPESGEPTFDETVYAIGTHARSFVAVEERDRYRERRGTA